MDSDFRLESESVTALFHFLSSQDGNRDEIRALRAKCSQTMVSVQRVAFNYTSRFDNHYRQRFLSRFEVKLLGLA